MKPSQVGSRRGPPVVLVNGEFDVVVVDDKVEPAAAADGTNPVVTEYDTDSMDNVEPDVLVSIITLTEGTAAMYSFNGRTDSTDQDGEPDEEATPAAPLVANMITAQGVVPNGGLRTGQAASDVLIVYNPKTKTYSASTVIGGVVYDFTAAAGSVANQTIWTAQVGGSTYQFIQNKTPAVAPITEYRATVGGTANTKVFQDSGGWYNRVARANTDEETKGTQPYLNAAGEPVSAANDAAMDKNYFLYNVSGDGLVQGAIHPGDMKPQILKRDPQGNYWLVYGRNKDGSLRLYGLGPDGEPNTPDDLGNANSSVLVGGMNIGYRTVSKENLTPELVAEIEAIDASEIETNRTDIATNSTAIAGNTTRITANEGQIAANKIDITANTTAIAGHETRITANEGAIATNTASIGTAMGMIGDNTTSIAGLWEEVKDLEDDIEDMAAGVAMSLAMTNIPNLVGEQTFSVGVGVGFYDSEGAGAIGVNARLSDNAVGRASVAFGGGEVGGGAGVSFSW